MCEKYEDYKYSKDPVFPKDIFGYILEFLKCQLTHENNTKQLAKLRLICRQSATGLTWTKLRQLKAIKANLTKIDTLYELRKNKIYIIEYKGDRILFDIDYEICRNFCVPKTANVKTIQAYWRTLYMNRHPEYEYNYYTDQGFSHEENEYDLCTKYDSIIKHQFDQHFIRAIARPVLGDMISMYQQLTEETIFAISDNINWRWASEYQQLSERTIHKFAHKVHWSWASQHQKLSESTIREFADKVNWKVTSQYQKLSESIIREFADKIDWKVASQCQKLSERTIREFADKIDWKVASQYQQLSESTIREFANKIDWEVASQYQQLSESTIREFAHKIDWEVASQYQKMSEAFIREFHAYVYKEYLRLNSLSAEAFINAMFPI